MKAVKVNDITGILAFIASVDWYNDRWLYLVLLFHAVCLTNIILFRRNHLVQTFIFVILMVSVYGAEYINEWAAKNYKLFSTEQYFDSNGLFFSVFYSFPALLNCCMVLIFWLYESGTLMVSAKRQMVERHNRSTSRTAGTSNDSDDVGKKRERLRKRPRIDEDSTESAEGARRHVKDD